MSYLLLGQPMGDCACQLGQVEGIIDSLIPDEVKYFFGKYFNQYLNTVAIVYDRVIHNACDTNFLGMSYDCIPYAVVKDVLDCYVSLQSKGKIAEYDPWASNARQIEETVALCAGTVQNAVRWVLYELYYSTADGTAAYGAAVLRAKSYDSYEPDRNPPDSIEIFVDDIVSSVKWLVLIAAVGVGGWYAYQWWTATRSKG